MEVRKNIMPGANQQLKLAVCNGPAHFNRASRPLKRVLADVQRQLEGAPATPVRALSELSSHLNMLRREQSTDEWNTTIAACRDHPLRGLLHQDPLTARAYQRPRGYQGDAALLDIVYARDYLPFCSTAVTELGHSIFRHTVECEAPSALRRRRDFLATQIDSVCAANPSAHILSVACGHLRETARSRAVQSRSFGRFVGLDQDQLSIDLVALNCGYLGVETVRGCVKALISGKLATDKFDFIYAAGLYDYLGERLAQRITNKLFEMLQPRGRLLVANYLPGLNDVGYMEAYSDWNLIYRDAASMRALTKSIAAPIAKVCVFPDESQRIVYLDVFAC